MTEDPMGMSVEELDAVYGKPEPLAVITHVLGVAQNANHNRITVEVVTESSQRLNLRFTTEALRSLITMTDAPSLDGRPRIN